MKTIFTLIQDKLVQNSEILKDSNSLNCSSNSNIEIFDVSILNEKLEKISSLLKNSNSKGDFKNMEVSRIDKIRDEYIH